MLSSVNVCIAPGQTYFIKVSDWIKIFKDSEGSILQCLEDIYGQNQRLINERKSMFLKTLGHFQRLYGSHHEVVITRSPCRINLRGMHSEMQHATPNYLTHCREVVMIAGRRNDDLVVLNNIDSERFSRRQFSISEEKARGKWGNWGEYIDSPGVRNSIQTARGDWANYVKASVLKLQDSFPEQELKGMDIVTSGDVPRGSGMASSSAVVVSSALAAMAVNGLTMDRRDLTVCLGQGEWYVGTRGGFGDHGAMLFGKRGHILHSVFLSAEEIKPEYIPLPTDYQVIIVNSYKTSSKSAERLFAYNQTMFAYSMALTLIKSALADMGYSQEFLNELNYLGQITPESFGLQRIYQILRALPEKITVTELRKRYSASEINSRLDRFFGQLKRFPDSVEVRGAVLWGIAESERSRAFARLMKDGRIKEAGELMYIGHDGDRLLAFNDNGESVEFTENKVTDAYLDALIADLQSGEPARIKRAQLARQPGDFDASSFELDTIVEVARQTPGVVGASLTGAGFGGNILVLAEKSSELLTKLRDALFENYYGPQEQAELRWLREERELLSALGEDEISQIRSKLEDIVERKRNTRTRMGYADIEYAESVQRRINALFKEGKIGRELLFIPADYYAEGVVVNVPVDGAGIL